MKEAASSAGVAEAQGEHATVGVEQCCIMAQQFQLAFLGHRLEWAKHTGAAERLSGPTKPCPSLLHFLRPATCPCGVLFQICESRDHSYRDSRPVNQREVPKLPNNIERREESIEAPHGARSRPHPPPVDSPPHRFKG